MRHLYQRKEWAIGLFTSLMLSCASPYILAATTNTQETKTTACERRYFGMSISPMQWVARGGSTTFVFTVTNNDTAECPPSRFSFYINPTTGWIKPILSVEAYTIPAGSSATIPFTVRVSSAAPAGTTYPISINAFNPTPPASGGNTTTAIGVI